MEKFTDECGVVGISVSGSQSVAPLAYFALNGIQHRGQESCGIAIVKDDHINCFKNNGLVTEVFDEKILSLLQGDKCLGHVNSKPDKMRFSNNAQPFVINYSKRNIAVAYNGGLVNAKELRLEMEDKGAVFTSSNDCEMIAYSIAQNDKGDLIEAIKAVMRKLKGGYAFVVLTAESIIGVRDPFAIRPLCYGTVEGGFAIASESCAIDLMGGEIIRDLKPGEIIEIKDHSVTSYETMPEETPRAACMFEYVYFSRPDSTVDDRNIFSARELAGRILARESPAEADIVLGVPDSGTPAATGYALESGIPYSASLIKNKYIGRTFIMPDENQRNQSVKIKINPIRDYILGKRITIVDDSIVRGTTMRNLIASIKELGALTVHLRISSPPVYHSCPFGVETPDQEDMVANKLSKDELAKSLGADSLEYISIEGLIKSAGNDPQKYCVGCFTGTYPNV